MNDFVKSTPEPAMIAETLRLVLFALVVTGLVAIDEPAIEAVTVAVGAVVSLVLSLVVRSRVTPVE